MILYHGSFLEIAKPDLVHSRPNVDFGRGFYVTPLYEQAAKWCGKFKRRGKDGIISRYEYDERREAELKTLKFDSYSEEWLDFILSCRRGKDLTDYDFVVGGVANDKVFNTVELFFDGLIDKTEAINRLRYEKPNLQICFRTEKALSLLHFELISQVVIMLLIWRLLLRIIAYLENIVWVLCSCIINVLRMKPTGIRIIRIIYHLSSHCLIKIRV